MKPVPQKWLDEAKLAACIQATAQAAPCGVAIVFDKKRSEYRMYSADAWTKPSTPGLLPWSPPWHAKEDVLCVVEVSQEARAALSALDVPTKLDALLTLIAAHDGEARRVLEARGFCK